MSKLSKGFIHIYTGNGKGKTTAALGQALRAAGAGLKTYFAQFMKEYPYSELQSVKLLNEFINNRAVLTAMNLFIKNNCQMNQKLKKQLMD